MLVAPALSKARSWRGETNSAFALSAVKIEIAAGVRDHKEACSRTSRDVTPVLLEATGHAA
jgi:hypothetical protein